MLIIVRLVILALMFKFLVEEAVEIDRGIWAVMKGLWEWRYDCLVWRS